MIKPEIMKVHSNALNSLWLEQAQVYFEAQGMTLSECKDVMYCAAAALEDSARKHVDSDLLQALAREKYP